MSPSHVGGMALGPTLGGSHGAFMDKGVEGLGASSYSGYAPLQEGGHV